VTAPIADVGAETRRSRSGEQDIFDLPERSYNGEINWAHMMKRKSAHANPRVVTSPSQRSIARRDKPRTHRRAAEIVEAAAQVFAERGFHGATTQGIADVLGIRQSSVYYYIESKEDALEKVCLRGVEGVLAEANEILRSPGSPKHKLKALIVAHLMRIRDHFMFVKVFIEQRKHLPDVSRHRVGKMSRDLELIFEKVLRDGVKLGEFRADVDPHIVTFAILGMENTVTSWRVREDIPMEAVAEQFVRLVCDGVSAR
jgi:TetR/AcrR family transcriptional regulator, cholesterol catabolism regulator